MPCVKTRGFMDKPIPTPDSDHSQFRSFPGTSAATSVFLAESLELAVIVHFSESLTVGGWEGDIQLLDTASLLGGSMKNRAPSYIFETSSHSTARAGLDAPTSCLSFLNASIIIVGHEPGFASPPYASSNHPGLSPALLLSRYHL